MLKSQEEELSNLLIEYAAGNYTVKGKLSEKQDEVDMIIQGINMLGEELMATNVSKDYFLSIYNAVTDL
ncbi:MAG: CII-binding regulator of phage lambda lysogenization HflD, partial [Flavobacteriales bacterium]